MDRSLSLEQDYSPETTLILAQMRLGAEVLDISLRERGIRLRGDIRSKLLRVLEGRLDGEGESEWQPPSGFLVDREPSPAERATKAREKEAALQAAALLGLLENHVHLLLRAEGLADLRDTLLRQERQERQQLEEMRRLREAEHERQRILAQEREERRLRELSPKARVAEDYAKFMRSAATEPEHFRDDPVCFAEALRFITERFRGFSFPTLAEIEKAHAFLAKRYASVPEERFFDDLTPEKRRYLGVLLFFVINNSLAASSRGFRFFRRVLGPLASPGRLASLDAKVDAAGLSQSPAVPFEAMREFERAMMEVRSRLQLTA